MRIQKTLCISNVINIGNVNLSKEQSYNNMLNVLALSETIKT